MHRIFAQTKLGKLIGLFQPQRVSCSCLSVVAVLVALTAVPAAWGQTTWYVDDDAPNDPGPGDPTVSDPLEDGSADHPFDAIQEGIDAAVNGDTVLVLDGTYTGEGNKNLDYAGKAITVRSENGPETCIIDCENDGRGFRFHSAETAAAVVEGLTIVNGSAGYGGGVYCSGSSPTLTNCLIHGNSAKYRGGGVLCWDSSNPTLTDCTITGNSAHGYGGGIYCSDSSPTLSNCLISGNSVTDHHADGGGGVHCSGSSPTLTNCTISGNSAHGYGAGVSCSGGNPVLTNCTISGNWATGDDYGTGRGGGMSVWSGGALISDCLIVENRAGGGGGIYTESDALVLTGCTISSNVATGYGVSGDLGGGGILCIQCRPTIANCTIAGNTTGPWANGGGVCCHFSGANIDNCVIAGNSAFTFGGGIYSFARVPKITNCTIVTNDAGLGGGIACLDGLPTVANSVLWGNSADQGSQIIIESATLTVSYSDVQHGPAGVYCDGSNDTLVWGDGNIDADPGFAFEDDYHLTPGSPCIDAATNDPPHGLPPDDLDGNARPLDGDGDGTAVADMGAYEFNPDTPSIALSPATFEFFAPEGGPNPDGRILMIRNSGGGMLSWEVSEDCTWLHVEPTAGESVGEVDQVLFSVDGGGLSYGRYECPVVVSDSAAVNSPRTVRVVLYVNTILHVPDAYQTIQAAIDESLPGDIILLADGVYVGPGNKDLDFGGQRVTVRSENGPENCIIDCEGDGRGFYFHNAEDSDSVVDGLTIRNGYLSGDSVGGAISCYYNSSPTIINCVISNSMAGHGGGVGCFIRSSPTITNCTISGNVASGFYGGGGGVYLGDARNPTIANCTISGNVASASYGGGGVCCVSSNATITNCAISGNHARNGGAVYCLSGSTMIANCMISGNVAEGTRGGEGGGVYCYRGNARISNCTITANAAATLGGGVHCYRKCDASLANSVLWDNSATDGAEIVLTAYSFLDEYPMLRVAYCDVAGGEDAAYVEDGCTLIWDDGNIDADPLFADPYNADYHLSAGSPCIDAGCNCAMPDDSADLDGDGILWEYLPFDLDGEGRFFDDPDTPDSGSGLPPIVDMGAYEFGGSDLPPCHGDLDGDRDVDMEDLAVLLAHYGTSEGANGADGDMDCDGDIDIADLAEFLGTYGDVCE